MRRDERDRRALERQLPSIATSLARSVRAGATLPLALDEVAAGAAPPARGDLLALVRAQRRGAPLDDALHDWSRHRGSAAVGLLVAACRLGHADGGDLAAALDGVAGSLLDGLEVADEARALSAQARSSAAVLVALPVVGAAGFALLDPAVARTLLTTRAGWVCLLVAGLLDLTGARVIARLVRSATS